MSFKDQLVAESPPAMHFIPFRFTRPQMLPPLLCSRRLYVYILLLLSVVLILVFVRLITKVKVNFVHFHMESDSDAELVTLPSDFAQERGAYCLDGSPPAYYYRPSLFSIKYWIIYLPGGAWCDTDQSCYERSLTHLGSSRVAKTSIPLSGILSNSCEVNPDFCLWNVLILHYCDGASFLGNDTTVHKYESHSLYLRGAVVFEALIDYLKTSTDLSESEQVVLAGTSAGGIAALIHADHLRSLLPQTVKTLHVLVDAALFIDTPDIQGQFPLANYFKAVYSLHSIQNSTSIGECTTTQNSTNGWRCLLPEVYYKFVFTPIFFINSLYDSWLRGHILKIPCLASSCPTSHRDVVLKARDSILHLAHEITKYKKNGVYLTGCPVHTIIQKNIFSSIELGDPSLQKSLALWLRHDLVSVSGIANVQNLETAIDVCTTILS